MKHKYVFKTYLDINIKQNEIKNLRKCIHWYTTNGKILNKA